MADVGLIENVWILVMRKVIEQDPKKLPQLKRIITQEDQHIQVADQADKHFYTTEAERCRPDGVYPDQKGRLKLVKREKILYTRYSVY